MEARQTCSALRNLFLTHTASSEERVIGLLSSKHSANLVLHLLLNFAVFSQASINIVTQVIQKVGVLVFSHSPKTCTGDRCLISRFYILITCLWLWDALPPACSLSVSVCVCTFRCWLKPVWSTGGCRCCTRCYRDWMETLHWPPGSGHWRTDLTQRKAPGCTPVLEHAQTQTSGTMFIRTRIPGVVLFHNGLLEMAFICRAQLLVLFWKLGAICHDKSGQIIIKNLTRLQHSSSSESGDEA